ncbi:4864_t:CDS:2 [Acaulospora colombiana]|uniref:4864_t:CDS:1 n=1 Tax=Acaulospora colombiana TaxID=27376 RepID=A0ACA9KCM2_9GLOM|nr:4864_t:CDS:2 [Acaulospora colombiana]
MFSLFRSRPAKEIEDEKHTRALLEIDLWSPPSFDTNQIRVILCQDTGDKAKLTLFDSDCVPQNAPESSNADASSWKFLGGAFLQKGGNDKNAKPVNSTQTKSPYSHHRTHAQYKTENRRRSLDPSNKSGVKTLPSSVNRNNGTHFSQRKVIINEQHSTIVP